MRLEIYPRIWHVWQLHLTLPQAVQSLDDIGQFLTSHLGLHTATPSTWNDTNAQGGILIQGTIYHGVGHVQLVDLAEPKPTSKDVIVTHQLSAHRSPSKKARICCAARRYSCAMLEVDAKSANVILWAGASAAAMARRMGAKCRATRSSARKSACSERDVTRSSTCYSRTRLSTLCCARCSTAASAGITVL